MARKGRYVGADELRRHGLEYITYIRRRRQPKQVEAAPVETARSWFPIALVLLVVGAFAHMILT